MKEYLTAIIIISIAICTFELLAPNNEKMIRLIGALCVICVVIAPLNEIGEDFSSNFLEDLRDKLTEDTREELEEEFSDILNKYLNEYSTEAYRTQIKELLLTNFDIPYNECEVKIFTQFTDNRLTVSEIQVLLQGSSIFKNPYEIEEYVSKISGSSCKVLIK